MIIVCILARLFALLAALLAAACGGGGAAAPARLQSVVRVQADGDSLLVAGALDVKPTDKLQQLLGAGYRVEMRAVSGEVIHQILVGGPTWPWRPFAEQLQIDHPDVALLRFGGADTIALTDPAAFRADLVAAVRAAKAAGAKVYLMGVIFDRPQYAERSALMDQINREVAQAEGVHFIDVRSLPFNLDADLAPGDVHPTQGYSDRIMALVAAQILEPTP